MFKIEWYSNEYEEWVGTKDDFDDVDEAIRVAKARTVMNGSRYRVVSFTIYWESK